ncbi:MAG: hypothetical protein M3020_06195 [Myxococcota bacterium]|jgi:hypothetical protein|nr:hypothetical protein [Myxococcota bacterium]
MRRVLWATCLFTLLGCQRKAPGPEECQTFAMAALGASRIQDLALVGAGEKYQELVRECLTTPFDRQLVQCMQLTGRARSCFQAFERRRLGAE